MRAPANPSASLLGRLVLAAASLLAAAMLTTSALADEPAGEREPANLASYLANETPRINADVALSRGEPEPVLGSFVVDGLAYAVTGEGQVTLVAVAPVILADGLAADVPEGEGASGDGAFKDPESADAPEDAKPEAAREVEAPSSSKAAAEPATLALPEAVAYEGASYVLTAVGPRAFAGCSAGTVALPAAVASVDPLAFRGSSVEALAVVSENPNLASFDGMLFDADRSSLLLIPEGKQGAARIPSTAEEVGASVFSHSDGVSAISVDAGSAAFSSRNGCLYDASGEILLRVPAGATDIEIADGCTAVAAGAMAGCARLAAIHAPATVAQVSPEAFEAPFEALVSPSDLLAGEGEGPSSRHSAIVALAGADAAPVDPAAVEVALPEGADASPWERAGFRRVAAAPVGGREGVDEGLPEARLGEEGVYASDFVLHKSYSWGQSEDMRGMPAGIALGAYVGWGWVDGETKCGPNAGWTFDYWYAYTWAAGTNKRLKLSDSIGQSTHISCIAHLSAYTVDYYSKDGSELISGGVGFTCNTAKNLLGASAVGDRIKYLEGAGWATEPDSETAAYGLGASVTNLTTDDGATVSLYLAGTPKSVTLTWDSQGGTKVAPTTQLAADGATVALPEAPTRTGYIFLGWRTGKDGAGSAVGASTALPSANATYYAHWRPIAYTIALDPSTGGAGTAVSPAAVAATYDADVTLPTPVRAGYRSVGWDTQPDGKGTRYAAGLVKAPNLTATDGVTVTLYARMTGLKYRISFDADGGEGGQASPVEATYGQPMPAISATPPTRRGHSFAGWWDEPGGSGGKRYYDADGSSARAWDKMGDATLYARWTANKYAVSFDAHGGTGGQASPVEATFGQPMPAISAEPPVRPGYYFGGWVDGVAAGATHYYNASSEGCHAWDKVGDATLYAQWRYRIAFDANAATDAAGVERDDAMAMTWKGEPFDGRVVAVYGHRPTLPTAERLRSDQPTGYRFSGWAVRQTDGSLRRVEAAELGAAGDDLAADLRPNGDAKLTLCALWEPLSYAISLDPVEPGAQGGDRTLSVAFDAPLPEASVPSCEGKAFLGYFSEPDGLGEMWYDHRGRPTHADAQGLPCYDVAGDVTLYAAWAEGSFLELDPSPGKWRDGSAEPERLGPFATGQELALPEPPARAGWIFAGWAEEGSDEALVGSRESHVVPDEARPLARPGQTARLHALWVPGIDVDMQLGGPASVTYSVFQDAEGGDRADGSKTLLSDVGGAHGGPTADGSVPTSLLDVSFAYWQDWSRGPSDAPVRFRNGAAGSPMDLYATSVLGEGATGDGGLFRSAADAREAVAVVTPLGEGVDWAYQGDASRMELSLDGGSRLVGTIAAGEGCPEGEQGAHALGELECALAVDLKDAAVDFASGNRLVEDVARIVWTASVRSDVSFDPNGATGGSVPASLVATLGQVLPDVGGEPPSRDGYEFTGWWDSPDSLLGEGTRYCDEQGRGIRAWNKVGSATLYAGWAYRQVELSWDAGEGAFPDGSHAMSTSQEFRDGAVVALPRAADGALAEPVRRGYSFGGWFDAPQGGSQVLDGQSPLPSADATFHARWEPCRYELAFDLNGGSPSDGAAWPALEAVFGTALPALSAQAPVREGHAFLGWFDGPDWRSAEKVYEADGSPVPSRWDRDSDARLYAGWAVEHEVSYCLNHKNYAPFVSADMPLSRKVLDGEPLAVFDLTPHVSQSVPMRFAGWSLESGIGNELDYPVGSTIPDVRSDLTLYTCWEAK